MTTKTFNPKDFGLESNTVIEINKPFNATALGLDINKLAMVDMDEVLSVFELVKGYEVDIFLLKLAKEFNFYLIPVQHNNKVMGIVDMVKAPQAFQFLADNINIDNLDTTMKLIPMVNKKEKPSLLNKILNYLF